MTYRPWHGRRPEGRFVLLAALAFGCALATIRVLPDIEGWGTTHAGSSATALAADMAAGLGLLLVGVFIASQPPGRTLGVLVTLAGVAWFAADWVGWESDMPAVRSVATIVAPFFAPILLHIVAIAPTGRMRSRAMAGLVLGGYVLTGLVTLALVAVNDPWQDPSCWNNCTDNDFLIISQPDLAGRLKEVGVLVAAALGIATVGVCATRLAGATGTARRVLWPVMVPACLVGLVITARGAARIVDPMEDPVAPLDAGLFLVLAWSVAALAGGLAWLVLRARHVHAELTSLVAELDDRPAPGTVAAALARAVGDPDLAVTYRLGQPERWVDSSGSTVDPARSDERHAVTRVVQDGELVALIRHDTAVVDPAHLERQLGPAARLAIDNERLGAEVLARLEELHRSRARIVSAGDAERRRLERDLHDGAQQRLLALAYDLRVARATAAQEGQAAAATILDGAIADARACHTELRDLAHGIFPAILSEAGLKVALETLADRAPIALSVTVVPERPCGSDMDPAVYAVVDEAVTDAAGRGATRGEVAIAHAGAHLTVTVEDDGARRRVPVVHLADRVGAAGGRLSTEATGVLVNRLEVVIPCG